jgi:hypothetical protein
MNTHKKIRRPHKNQRMLDGQLVKTYPWNFLMKLQIAAIQSQESQNLFSFSWTRVIDLPDLLQWCGVVPIFSVFSAWNQADLEGE